MAALATTGGCKKDQESLALVSHAELDRANPEGDVNSLLFAPNGNAIIAGTDACGYVLVCN